MDHLKEFDIKMEQKITKKGKKQQKLSLTIKELKKVLWEYEKDVINKQKYYSSLGIKSPQQEELEQLEYY